jgi:hypothetical protein
MMDSPIALPAFVNSDANHQVIHGYLTFIACQQ